MRKKVTLLLAAVVAVLMIAGCSSGDDDKAAQQTQPPSSEQTTQAATSESQQNLIGEQKAKEIALMKVEGAKESHITKFKLDKDDGRQEYEGEIVYNNREYDFEIDAVSGEILSWEDEAVNQ
ncbi:PepSY domain-containing protein [Ihubacter massiliensis]|uniref:PepSY domain-containing protein n=1 Tax=Hominibacterium faecale TaxID=2839743 RepID=A0A9J6QYU3_9FIRM|nr:MULTISPECIES: PepSY domain-containing protein [Eubacteriales Family XIII. Incertae Sedis]MCO7123577.1 PepSY domain-containing protein [Ihubacter massiliensis]MCU7380673.1 PepSY domain-containing protein [Hominibacterium faecale]